MYPLYKEQIIVCLSFFKVVGPARLVSMPTCTSKLGLGTRLATAKFLIHLAHLKFTWAGLIFRSPSLLVNLLGRLISRTSGRSQRAGRRGLVRTRRPKRQPPILFRLPPRPLSRRKALVVKLLLAVVLEPYVIERLALVPFPRYSGARSQIRYCKPSEYVLRYLSWKGPQGIGREGF